jgi:sugar transferase (PEP-CTERM/EpsH1 system associated)
VRILFLTHRLPYAPNRGDRVRAYHLLRVLSRRADVDLLSLVHDEEEASHASDLASLASSVTVARVRRFRNLMRSAAGLAGSTPTTHTMLDSPTLDGAVAALAERAPDVVLAYCSGMARCAFMPALAGRPMVLDMVDVDSAKWSALADSAAVPLAWVYAREARVLRRFEAAAARRAKATLVVTEKERRTMTSVAPDARVQIVPNGVEADRLRPGAPPSAEPVVVFCGVMNYAPNVEAVDWFARQVWPRIIARRPDARFEIVGSDPSPAVRSLAGVAPGIQVVGAVPDVAPRLWNAGVSVAPLLKARGVQNKVLEAVAAGLPTVVTPIVAEGLPEVVLRACRVAGTADAFGDAVLELLARPPAERRALAASVDFQSLSWDRTLGPVYEILEQAASRN